MCLAMFQSYGFDCLSPYHVVVNVGLILVFVWPCCGPSGFGVSVAQRLCGPLDCVLGTVVIHLGWIICVSGHAVANFDFRLVL